jgi:HSP20 family protein
VARIFIERRSDELEAEAIRRLVALLDAAEGGSGLGECAPPVDVVELADRVEIIMDLPGVSASSMRVVYSRGTVIIAGRKVPRVCDDNVAFHLAERTFGRFARALSLAGAFDAGRATAALKAGELRVILPRIEERRGRDIPIDVTSA